MTQYESDLAVLAEGARLMDRWLDENVSAAYQGQPLAQDWARVSKVAEELGEAIAVLISITRQNPRKADEGYTTEDLISELADVSLTAMYAIQHFLKDEGEEAVAVIVERCTAHVRRLPPVPQNRFFNGDTGNGDEALRRGTGRVLGEWNG